jgi:hypothetical protein
MGDDRLKRDRTVSLHQGANTRLGAHLLDENQCVDLENMIVNRVGKRTRRDGCRAFGGRIEDPGGIFGYEEVDQDRRLVGVWGQQLYRTSGGGDWAEVATGTSLPAGGLHMFQMGMGLGGHRAMYYCTADHTATRARLQMFDVQNDAHSAATLSPNTIAWFQGRLWSGEGDNVWWSELLDGLAYSSANQITVDPAHAGRVTRLVPARGAADRLWIFKERAIYLFVPTWTGDTQDGIPGAADSLDTLNSRLQVLTDGVGCIAPRSAIWVPSTQGADIFFLAHDGIRSMARAEQDVEGGAGPALSDNIPDWVNRVNFQAANRAAAAYFDDAYHLALPLDGATDNTHILRYEPRRECWSLHDLAMKDLTLHDLSLTQYDMWGQSLVRGNDTSATNAVADPTLPHQMYRIFDGNLDPNGQRVLWSEVSRAFMFDEPLRRKTWDSLSLVLSAPQTCYVEVQTRVDYGEWDTAATMMLAGGEDAIVLGENPLTWQSSADELRRKDVYLRDLPKGYNMQYRLTSDTATSDTGPVTVWISEVRAHIEEEEYLSDS